MILLILIIKRMAKPRNAVLNKYILNKTPEEDKEQEKVGVGVGGGGE